MEASVFCMLLIKYFTLYFPVVFIMTQNEKPHREWACIQLSLCATSGKNDYNTYWNLPIPLWYNLDKNIPCCRYRSNLYLQHAILFTIFMFFATLMCYSLFGVVQLINVFLIERIEVMSVWSLICCTRVGVGPPTQFDNPVNRVSLLFICALALTST